MRTRLEAVVVLTALALVACGGDRSRSPTCGLALLVGPTAIQQRFGTRQALITKAPRGLPASLPARVAGQGAGEVLVGYETGGLLMEFQGTAFPRQPGYALLVVDDTSQRAMGVLVYDTEGPRDYPAIGRVTGSELSVPLYGVRVDWASVSNPACPLLGAPPPATPAVP